MPASSVPETEQATGGNTTDGWLLPQAVSKKKNGEIRKMRCEENMVIPTNISNILGR